MTASRVELPVEVRQHLTELRQASGITNAELCRRVGIRQPVTFYAWERGLSRPTLPNCEAYLAVIGADAATFMPQITVGPSRLERVWETQYRGSPSNRGTNYVPLIRLEAEVI